MATKYSSLYGQNPSDSTNFIYRGPSVHRTGEICVRQFTFLGTLAASDILVLAAMRAGEKIIGVYNNRDGDPDAANDFTFNLGFTSAPTTFASASTAMQAAVKFELTAGDLILKPAAVKGDSLILTAQAGAAEVAVTHYFTVFSHLQQP